ncbi:hypothetical protein GTO91_06550 [Heliobacterium undosum]|uniref:Uncharacterized protein n=1 Tax=Heliomicrobium undosum TaxID=121734 RepID=A0A845L3E0_9FIRM|nr:hypothetical protein [Heliomicrobium undosum]MZP29364.1 hypothetical protein [Heliomicrobium undosum]
MALFKKELQERLYGLLFQWALQDMEQDRQIPQEQCGRVQEIEKEKSYEGQEIERDRNREGWERGGDAPDV